MTKPSPALVPIRDQYVKYTAKEYYEKFGHAYRIPHEPKIRPALLEVLNRLGFTAGDVLDLACGSGEVTLVFQELGCNVSGIDPYTGAAYKKRTGLDAEGITFEDIANGRLAGRFYDLIVCSYAMHLADELWMPLLCYRLAEIGDKLMIISPHKRPVIKCNWGWLEKFEFIRERVHVRAYSRWL